jgi:hypothetical protein
LGKNAKCKKKHESNKEEEERFYNIMSFCSFLLCQFQFQLLPHPQQQSHQQLKIEVFT